MEQKDIMIDELAMKVAEATKELVHWKSLYRLQKIEIEELKKKNTKIPSEE